MYQMDIHLMMNDGQRVYTCKEDFYVSIGDKYSKIAQHKRDIIIYLQLNEVVYGVVDLNAGIIYDSSKKQFQLI